MLAGDLGERAVLRHVSMREGIQPPRDADQQALTNQPRKGELGQTQFGQIA